MIRSIPIASLLAVCLAITGIQSARAEDKATHGVLTSKDYKFVCEAAIGGQNEVTLSQLAGQKASDQSVKDFAQRMVADHQKANQELKQLTSDKGAILPDTETKKSEKLAEHLQNLSGGEFDRAYMKDMVSDHKKVVKLFEKAAEHSDDGDLKSWAVKTLPTLQDHLRMAESIDATLNGTKVASN